MFPPLSGYSSIIVSESFQGQQKSQKNTPRALLYHQKRHFFKMRQTAWTSSLGPNGTEIGGCLKEEGRGGLWCRKLGQLNFHHVTEKRLRTSLMHKQRTIPSPRLLYSRSQGSLSLPKSQSKSSYPILIPQWPDNQRVSLMRLIHLTWGDWTKTLPYPVEKK